MKLHEYQAKNILKNFDVTVPNSIVINNIDDLTKIEKNLTYPTVVKAQVHSGARGKAGGIKIAKDFKEVNEFVKSLLGEKLVTHQTGEKGLPINTILLEEAIDIQQELYLAITIDGSVSNPIFISSPQGGMDIEAVAEKDPGAILTTMINADVGLMTFQSQEINEQLNLEKEMMPQLHKRKFLILEINHKKMSWSY